MNGTLGRYQIVAELGRGGMGTVYLAVARGPARFNKLVVIKQLRRAFWDDATFIEMFLEEARLAARLNHPCIVQTNEVLCDPVDGYFIVMEYLDGFALKRIVRRLRARDRSSARPLYLQAILEVLTALHYAHTLKDFDGKPLNLVHRDVSPANVVIVHSGQVKLLDFGIAKAADSLQETRAGILKGRLHYMPPEQMAGDRIDHRADLFAAGAMLWDALVGRKLWDGLSGVEIIKALATGDIPSPRSVNAEISQALDRVCMRALASSPEDRYASATAFRADLESALGGNVMTTEQLGAALSGEFLQEQERMRLIIAAQFKAMAESEPIEVPNLSSHFFPSHTAQTDLRLLARAETAPPTQGVEESGAPQSLPAAQRARIRARVGGAVLTATACVVLASMIIARGSRASREKSSALREAMVDEAVTAAASSPPTATTQANELAGSRAPRAPETAAGPSPVPVVPEMRVPEMRVPEMRHTLHMAKNARAVASRRAAAPSSAQTPEAPDGPLRNAITPSVPSTGGTAWQVAGMPNTLPEAALAPSTPDPAPVPNTPSASDTPPSGTIPRAAVNELARLHADEIQRCFDRAQMDQPLLSARVTMIATITREGHVEEVTTSATRGTTATLQPCIENAVRGWSFPRPSGGVAAHVTYTFVFE